MSSRSRRQLARIDYTALNSGRGPYAVLGSKRNTNSSWGDSGDRLEAENVSALTLDAGGEVGEESCEEGDRAEHGGATRLFIQRMAKRTTVFTFACTPVLEDGFSSKKRTFEDLKKQQQKSLTKVSEEEKDE
eukprot:TRINITY_DN3128_c0_g3_i2.p3 TRINITY_DN3128_c0_g3~~TRINITY_DN3128_c0_g3_i2.p3  ORF type:complete len:132 (+),score=29.66 TRINITY_DN3128_c0_g3_i2:1478-1873(+)